MTAERIPLLLRSASDFLRDVRYAARILVKSPGFTSIAVLTLALGIGANTAIFSLVDSVILKPLPFRDPSRLVAVWDTYLPQFSTLGISPPELQRYEQQKDLFEDTAWYRYVPENLDLTTAGSEALEVHGAVSSPELFSLLGVAPAHGHAFAKDEDPHSVLVSDKLWRTRFGADTTLVGETVHLNGDVFTIAGIMPANFQFPDWADIWLPPGPLLGDELTNPIRHAVGFIGRLRSGVSQAEAARRVEALTHRLAAEHRKTSTGFGTRVIGLKDDLTASVRPALLMLAGAVALVFLIACVNVANLLLSRANGRAKEIAVRTAMGAGAGRILRQLLTESILLAFVGGAFGLLLAKWTLSVLLPRQASLDPTVFAFLLGISIVAGILFGLAPAIQLLKSDVNSVIKSGSVTGSGGTRMRGALVIVEFALTIMLVIGAGILAKSFVRLMHVDPGFNPNGVLTLKLYVPPSRNPEIIFHRIEERVTSLPGVQSIATINTLPLIASRANAGRFNVPGSALINPDALPAAQLRVVTPDYFRAMQVPLLSGRSFTEQDLNQPVVLINETLAHRFWPNRNPVGLKFITGPWGPNPSWSTIIGVAADVKQFGLDSEPSMDIYFPAVAPNYLIVKTTGNPLAIANAVRRDIRAIDSEVAISDVRSMEEIALESARTRRWTMGLLAAFAGLALVLAIVGIYGVMSWAVAERTRELGIRMALGAQARDMLQMVVRDGMKLSFAGAALGLAGAFSLRHVLSRLVFGVSTADPLIYTVVPMLMLVVGLFASYIPARRAATIDAVRALYSE